MPQRQGKCINFGLCTMADSREAITLPEGEDFSCPECGKMLTEVEGKGGGAGKGGGKSKLALAGVAVALLAVGGYFLLAPEKSDPVPIPGPVDPPVKPPVDPPVTPPVAPPVTPPVDPPVTPPVNPVVKPPVEPPVEPPVKKLIEHRVKPPRPVKPPTPEPEVKVEPAYTGPTSGTIVWEGTVKKGELITIENGSADKGVILSGKLPGVPVLIAPLNAKKVAIAGAPGPDSKYQRIVLRIQANGQMKAELSWSVVP